MSELSLLPPAQSYEYRFLIASNCADTTRAKLGLNFKATDSSWTTRKLDEMHVVFETSDLNNALRLKLMWESEEFHEDPEG